MQTIYQPHPLANLMPAMTPESYEILKKSIQINGLLQPISVYQGIILDGRHRFQACLDLDLQPAIEEWNGADALRYVEAMNLARRQLSLPQRALAAASISTAAKGRNKHTATAAPSQEVAANLYQVSLDTLQRAKKVLANADPVIIEMVRKKELAISMAAQVAKFPKKEQLKALRSTKVKALAVADEDKARKSAQVLKERVKTIQTRIAKNKPLSEAGGPFSLIYADPPWRYPSTGESGSRLRIENQYPTMPIEDICALPVASICDDDAMLFLWVPSSLVRQGYQVLDAWGFEYSTQLVWHKKGGKNPYFGHVAFQVHETILVGKRGKGLPEPKPKNKPLSVFEAPKTEHSKKPELVYDMLERMYPEFKNNFCELFARNEREGWSSWGNEV